MSSSTDGIRNTQELVNAAEAFVKALGSLFSGDTFEQLFHGDSVRQAYWSALQEALEAYATPETAPLVRELLIGRALADPRVLAELLRLFLPDQSPDYAAIAGYWNEAMSGLANEVYLAEQAQVLFGLLSTELRRTPDLRLALEQLAQTRQATGEEPPVAMGDLDRLLDAALGTGPSALDRQIQHVMELAAGRDPHQPFALAAVLDALAHQAARLTPGARRRMWERLAEVDDPGLRLSILARLGPYAAEFAPEHDALALLEQEIARCDPFPPPAMRVAALVELLPHLDIQAQDQVLTPFQAQMLNGVRAIQDPASLVRALGVLIEKLPEQAQHEVVALAFDTAAREISNEPARAMALSALPPHLPPEFHARLMTMALELQTPDARALLLGRMIPHLSPALQRQALVSALDAIEQIAGDDARAEALIALAPAIESVGSLRNVPEALQRAIAVTFSIKREDARASTFAALAPFLSPELLSEALQAVRTVRDDTTRARALVKLGPHLSVSLSLAAFTVAQEIQSSEARAVALAAVTPYLPATARAHSLTDGLAAALAIERRYDRVAALVDLVPHLSPRLKQRSLREALTAVRSIPDEGERGRALVFLAPHLPQDWLADALADAYTISDPLERIPVLSALLAYLPADTQGSVLKDVFYLTSSVPSTHQKASILATIAPALPDTMVDDVLKIVAAMEMPYNQMHVLRALLPHYTARVRDLALATARAITDEGQRVTALLEIVPFLPVEQRPALLQEALDNAQRIMDDYDRASAFTQLVPFVDAPNGERSRQQDSLRLALEACFEEQDLTARTALLEQVAVAWVAALAPAQSYGVWRRVVAFLREQPRSVVLVELAALTPVLEHIGAVTSIERVAGELLECLNSPC